MKPILSLFTATAISIAACSAHAAPAHPAAIEQLLILSRAELVLDTMLGSAEQSIRQGMLSSIGNQPLTPKQQQAVQIIPSRVAQMLRQELNWTSLKTTLIPVYSATFSQEEIDGLIQFYRSPVGRQFATKQPELAQRSMDAAQQMLLRAAPRINAAMESALRELAAQ